MSPALLSSRAVASRVDSAAAVGIRTVVATWSQARLLSVVTRGTAPIHLTPDRSSSLTVEFTVLDGSLLFARRTMSTDRAGWIYFVSS